ncbi:MAG TPA: heme transporter, partial [Polyangiaceae bacterium LLY-WYZ-14_1]|nr:heme transporter [Polyangiaceae bacterium LLY-WYZ-14_1]
GMIFLAYLSLRGFGQAGEAERRFSAALAVVGLCLVPIIHFSVQRWRGQHPTVISRGGGGLHPDMVPALILSFVAFTFLVALLIYARTRVELERRRLEALELDTAELGLLDAE